MLRGPQTVAIAGRTYVCWAVRAIVHERIHRRQTQRVRP
jgi:hypothetical protein